MATEKTVINSCPHEVAGLVGEYVPGQPFEKESYPPDVGFEVRLTTIPGKLVRMLGNVPVYSRPTYTVTREGLGKGFDSIQNLNEVTLIVSTMVAERADELRALLNAPEMKIVVPDSGPEAIRIEGRMEAGRRYFDY